MSADLSIAQNGKSTEIAKLAVYHLARLIFPESALTGAMLEKHRFTETFESDDRTFIEDVLARIAASAAAPANAACDSRWGLVFSDAAGNRCKSLYLNKFGNYGILDDVAVTFRNESLIEWLREKYGADSVLA